MIDQRNKMLEYRAETNIKIKIFFNSELNTVDCAKKLNQSFFRIREYISIS